MLHLSKWRLNASPEHSESVCLSLAGSVQILLKAAQETDGTERYHKLAFGPGNIIAAAFGTTIHFLDARHGTLLESIEVRPCPISGNRTPPATSWHTKATCRSCMVQLSFLSSPGEPLLMTIQFIRTLWSLLSSQSHPL